MPRRLILCRIFMRTLVRNMGVLQRKCRCIKHFYLLNMSSKKSIRKASLAESFSLLQTITPQRKINQNRTKHINMQEFIYHFIFLFYQEPSRYKHRHRTLPLVKTRLKSVRYKEVLRKYNLD